MLSYSNLPRTGIGNKLFVWAQGYVFSLANDCPHATSGWVKIHIGPIIRKENSKRFYWGYVPFKSTLKSFFWLVRYFFYTKVQTKPSDCYKKKEIDTIYVFNTLPHSNDYFSNIRAFRGQIKEQLGNYLSPSIIEKVSQKPCPAIGVHIRLGDFKVGQQTTPIAFFVDHINRVRALIGQDAPVTLFTDGNTDEVQDVLRLGHVFLSKNNRDIEDLLWLSRSKVIILTSNSTFSQWAGFLSEAVLLYDEKIIITPIRDSSELFEGNIADFETNFKKLYEKKNNFYQ